MKGKTKPKKMNEALLAKLSQRIEQADRILIVSHERPDGDAVSSVLAFGFALQEESKQVVMALADGVPAALRFLPGSEQIVKKVEGDFDLIIVLDCGNQDRVGGILNGYSHVDINIDHHESNPLFGEINLVDGNAVSTTEILAQCFPVLELNITKTIASLLLAGILIDSQGFKTANTSPKSLRISADLIEQGADLQTLFFDAITRKTYEAVNYWGVGLSQLKRDGSMVWTSLSLHDRKVVKYSGRDDADLVNILTAIDGAEVAIIFVEQDDQRVKVSWRARSDFDVAQVAQQFGGGGHVAAAGAMVNGQLQEVEEKVIRATREALGK
jgi:phosphoesterase RecJ-like protein